MRNTFTILLKRGAKILTNNDVYKINTPNIKELQIELQKNITTYLTFSLPLCAILANKENYSWLYEHFIQLYTLTDDNGKLWVDYLEDRDFYKDIADYNIIGADKMKNEDNIIEFIVNKINSEYYVIIFVDEYYLSNKNAYNKFHFVHQLMVYGYNNEECSLNTIAFDNNNKFNILKYTFTEFKQAYENGKNSYSDDQPWLKNETVEIIRPKAQNNSSLCNTKAILTNIKKYVSGKDEYSKIRPFNLEVFGDNASFNNEVLSQVEAHLKYWERNEVCIDYRYIHLIYEHKVLMFDRIQYISELYNLNMEKIIKDYSVIKDESIILKNIFLKQELKETNFKALYRPIKDKDTINKLCNMLGSIKERETTILNTFCEVVSKLV